jgi:hypothetical protein
MRRVLEANFAGVLALPPEGNELHLVRRRLVRGVPGALDRRGAKVIQTAAAM